MSSRCCYVHDRCYEEADKLAATEGGASWFFGSYFSGYQYDCIDSKIVCCKFNACDWALLKLSVCQTREPWTFCCFR